MHKVLEKRANLKKIVFVFALLLQFLIAQNCCCPCYLERTFTNVEDVRTQISVITDLSKDSISKYTREIAVTQEGINNAISSNNSRRGCKQINKMWGKIKNADSTGVFDLFLKEWNRSKVLPEVFSQTSERQINDILNQIREAENTVKEKRKPCKK